MKRSPTTVLATRLLLALDALVWFAFGVMAASGAIASIAHPLALRWVMAVLAWVSAAVLAGLAFLLSKRVRLAFYMAILLLILIAALSVTDQVGWLDLAALAISVAPLVLLLKDRAWYLRRTDARGSQAHD
jgi:hypothetical protein